MGRHRDPDPRYFWQSLAVALGKLLALVVVVALAAFGLTRAISNGGIDDPTPQVSDPTGEADDLSDELADAADAAAADTVAVDDLADADVADSNAAEEGSVDVEDGGDEAAVRATVQVLNASGDAALLDEVSQVLEEMGYAVVARSRAARGYDQTVIMWSDGFRTEAEAMRNADRRFTLVQPNERLDPSIDLHVIIGADWTQ